MTAEFVNEYIDFLNSLKIIQDNDTIRFVVKRKNHIFLPDQLQSIVEKYHINIVIDGVDYFFAVIYVNPRTRKIKIKYNYTYLNEILMCIGEDFTEFHELNINDIHLHVEKFNKKHFEDLIRRLIIEGKREKI